MPDPPKPEDYFLVPADKGNDVTFLSPARAGNTIEPLVDGSAFFPAVEEAMAAARESIFCTFWAIYPDTPLLSKKVRDSLKVQDWQGLLGKLARDRGVKIRIITSDFDAILDNKGHQRTWAGFNQFVTRAVKSKLTSDQFQIMISLHPAKMTGLVVDVLATRELKTVLTDLNAKRLAGLENSPGLWSLVQLKSGRLSVVAKPSFVASPATYHSKTLVIDHRIGFIGGINISDFYQNSPEHLGNHRAHDVFCRVEGPVVEDLERNFVGRWNDESARFLAFVTAANAAKLGAYRITAGPAITPLSPSGITQPTPGPALAQLHRTICTSISGTAPLVQATTVRDDIARTYQRAILLARDYIYLENQYFRTLDLAGWIADRFKANKALQVIIVLPVVPEELEEGKGDPITKQGLYLEHQALTYLQAALGRNLGLYSLIQNSRMPASTPAHTKGLASFGSLRIYPHSKVLIVDDVLASIGSANTNPRSFQLDSETDLAWHDPASAKALREQLWREHLASATGSLFSAWKPANFVKEWDRIAATNSKALPERRQGFVVPHDPSTAKGAQQPIPDFLSMLEAPSEAVDADDPIA